jgi:SAM-dependent methyltransferase
MLKKFLSKIRKPKDSVQEDGVTTSLPIPPIEIRRLAGPTDPRDFDNPDGRLLWGDLVYGPLKPGEAYQHIFDFGCGCGRNARQFLLQHQPPIRYVGIDISRAMIEWCQKNLRRPGVQFFHHDVWSPNPAYAPDNSPNEYLPLRHCGEDFTLINAHSVFTHLLERQTRFYLKELRSMLAENGLFRTTWFFFNKAWFPVLNPDQHCLYVNGSDPTQAVYYDWDFFKSLCQEIGLKIIDASWTRINGYQSVILLARGEAFEDKSETIKPPETILGFGSSAPPSDLVFEDQASDVLK